ncbi:hypothetical protein ARMGADRAFT_1130721 [Armillaria gallica]|uniref:Uncharacterized protein n=1 Tax=Armillaria gallica TaxID=47427 RepID=A0A2H3DWW6_ARMGA|nr:hypothetical protein ARMGADRAFT_1130721 [Armillaria gallica]
MAAQAVLPPDLTNDDFHIIFETSDVYLSSTILQALMHGLYTGVLGVTLWSIFRSSIKNTSIRRYAMVLAIFALHILATIWLGYAWAFIHHAFIDKGQNCFTVFMELNGFSPMAVQATRAAGITSSISTFIADSSLIWRCWIMWGHQWIIIVIPVLCAILGTVFKGIQIYHNCVDSIDDIADSTFTARDILSGGYTDVLGAAIRGIAPTLLVGHVAAGYARPDDSWQDSTSTVSSLNFGTGSLSTQDGGITQSAELNEMDNLDPGLERNSALIEEVAQETRSLDIV